MSTFSAAIEGLMLGFTLTRGSYSTGAIIAWVALLVMGVWLSFHTHKAAWLVRFASLVVASAPVAALLKARAASDLGDKLQNLIQEAKSEAEMDEMERMDSLTRMESGLSDADLEDMYFAIGKEPPKERPRMDEVLAMAQTIVQDPKILNKLSKRFYPGLFKLEVGAVVVGTVIGGFGDMLPVEHKGKEADFKPAIEQLEHRVSLLDGSRDRLEIRATDLENRVLELEKRRSIGLDYPPCWETGEGSKRMPEYIYDVTIRDQGMEIRPAWPIGRERQIDTIPGARALVSRSVSVAEFRRHALPVFQWSQAHDCRLFVRIHDVATTKAYDDYRRAVESVFYKIELMPPTRASVR